MLLNTHPQQRLGLIHVTGRPTAFHRAGSPDKPRPAPVLSSFHYHGIAAPPRICWLAVLVSVGLHAGMLLGFNQHKPRPRVVVHEEKIEQIQMTEELKEPEEEMPRELSDSELVAAPSVNVPSLMDVPVLVPLDSTFVQQLDLTVPLKSDVISGLVAIPTNIRHGRPDASGIKNLFNISELDKAPEPVVQTPPAYPWELKREGIEAQVRVGFIVDSNGNVVLPYIVSSSHSGFERAALDAVVKWKFRPGIKTGRKVNTRVEQPMTFKVEAGG